MQVIVCLTNLIVGLFVAFSFAQSGRVRTTTSKRLQSKQVSELTVVPEGTLLELRLERTLDSRSSKRGELFVAPLATSVLIGGRVAIPRTAAVVCRVISVEPAGRNRKNGSIKVTFDELVLATGERYLLNATLVSIADGREDLIRDEGQIKDTSKKQSPAVIVGTGGIIGAGIGAVSGTGAATGGAVGAGVALGSVLLAKGQDVVLPAGMLLQVRLDKALELRR